MSVFGNCQPLQWAFCKVLELQPGVAIVKQNILLELASALTVKIQDEAGYPRIGVWAMGLSSRNSASPVRLERDVCSAYSEPEVSATEIKPSLTLPAPIETKRRRNIVVESTSAGNY